MWIVIYIIHSDIFCLCNFWQKGFLHVFDEISTSYPQFVDILGIMWISIIFLWKRCVLYFILILCMVLGLTSIFLWYIIVMIFSNAIRWISQARWGWNNLLGMADAGNLVLVVNQWAFVWGIMKKEVFWLWKWHFSQKRDREVKCMVSEPEWVHRAEERF